MNPNNNAIISPEELKIILNNDNVKIYDVRTGPNAQKDYLNLHISKANFVSLENDLSNIGDFKNGGRHPLPEVIQFIKTIENLGISENNHIIIYDDKNGANAAARFWWMLKSIGHDKVQVIDGGLQNAISRGINTNSGQENYKPTTYPQKQKWQLPTVDINSVEQATKDSKKIIIDVRENYRYNGESEPIDLVAGHIPNAINLPFIDNLNEKGIFLNHEKLKSNFEEVLEHYKPEDIIVHCGSGVTACHTILAMYQAGYKIPNLYVGSWSEWSRNNLY